MTRPVPPVFESMEMTEPTVESASPLLEKESMPSRGVLPSRVCILTFGSERLAITLSQVRGIFKLDSITSVPGMPPTLVGVANLRGTILPILDLHPWFGLPSVATPNYAVVVRHEAMHVGILVDDLPEIRAIGLGEVLEPMSGEAMSQRPFLSGVLHTVGLAIGVIDVSRLLAMIEGGIVSRAA